MNMRVWLSLCLAVVITACGGDGAGGVNSNLTPVTVSLNPEARTGLYRPASSIIDIAGNVVPNAELDYMLTTNSGNPLTLIDAELLIPDAQYTFSVDGNSGPLRIDRTVTHDAQSATRLTSTELDTTGTDSDGNIIKITSVLTKTEYFGVIEDDSNNVVLIEQLFTLFATDDPDDPDDPTFGERQGEITLNMIPVSAITDPLAVPNLEELLGQTLIANTSAIDVTAEFRIFNDDGTVETTSAAYQIAPTDDSYFVREYSDVMTVNNITYSDVITVDAVLRSQDSETGQIVENQQVLFVAKGIGVIRIEPFATIDDVGVADIELISFNFD